MYTPLSQAQIAALRRVLAGDDLDCFDAHSGGEYTEITLDELLQFLQAAACVSYNGDSIELSLIIPAAGGEPARHWYVTLPDDYGPFLP